MRVCWTLGLLILLVATSLGVPPMGRAVSADDVLATRRPTLGVSNPAVGIEAALARLPPGARPAKQRLGMVEEHTARGNYLVEEIQEPDGESGSSLRVEYTVVPELEQAIRSSLLQGQVALGHVVVLDPSTGEIYAYVSSDPERFPGTRTYPMASLMKVVTGAALLRLSPNAATRDCRFVGSRWELHAEQLKVPPIGSGFVDSFRSAIAHSNNQCFARFAVHDLGKEPLLAEMRTAGLLDAPAALHPAGRVESPSGALALGHLGSGMAGAFISPLAAARLAATLARGERVEPFWIAQVRDAEGSLVTLPPRDAPRPVWTGSMIEELRQGMLQTTETGTASSAFRDLRGSPLLGNVRVAGKTGTVSGTDPKGRYQWFIGVAPAEAPQIAVATVVVDDPPAARSASQVAAAVLRIVFCEAGDCNSSRAEPLLARARMREDERASEIARLETVTPEPVITAHAQDLPPRAPEPAQLDQPIRPIGDPELAFPSRLRKKKVSGKVVLLLTLSKEGRVLEALVDSSDLPAFNDFVSREVKAWSFTPPRRGGRPVVARARLPIPIRVD